MKKEEEAKDFSEFLDLGEFYILSGNFSAAVKALKKAQKIKHDFQVFYNLGIAYEGLSKREEAVEAFQAALEIEPDNEKAREHLTKLIEEKL